MVALDRWNMKALRPQNEADLSGMGGLAAPAASAPAANEPASAPAAHATSTPAANPSATTVPAAPATNTAASAPATNAPAAPARAEARDAAADRLAARFARPLYGLLGIPVDATTLDAVVAQLQDAAATQRPLYLSTPNLNFLILSQSDPTFREALLASDLCPADGMPIVWLARLLGVPLQGRIAGSDVFDALRMRVAERPIRVFLFGGVPGVAEIVCDKINSTPGGLVCVGLHAPGFGPVAEMSTPAILEHINASGADFVSVFLNAAKSQAWLLQNAALLKAPIRAALGATLNFQAGTVRRAPAALRALGLEWLWRIKEEPYLWQRYLRDGCALLRLLAFSVLPARLMQTRAPHADLGIAATQGDGQIVLALSGTADAAQAERLRSAFLDAARGGCDVVLDLSRLQAIDARGFGLLLTLRQALRDAGRRLAITGASRRLAWQFRLNRFDYLLRRDP